MKYPGLLKRGAQGNAVQQVQRQLLHMGYRFLGPRGKELTIDGDFGTITEEAVIEFQMQNRDRQENPLVVDGQIGPLTWEVLFDEPVTDLGRPQPKKDKKSQFMAASLAVAESQVGVREVPMNSNSGPDVERYLTSIGLGPGYAWCAAFAYWCIQEAAAKQGFAEVPFIQTGWTPAIWDWAKQRGSFLLPDDVVNRKEKVEPGSLFLLHGNVKGKTRVKHVGFVESMDGGMVKTVEGNTNKAGSREGGGVYKLERKISSIYRFVMYG